MDVETLIKTLTELKYKDKAMNHEFYAISYSHRDLVEREIRLWASKQDEEQERKKLETKLGHLEAKCIAYEAIIKNSNFAPVIAALTQEHMAELKGAEEW